MAKDWIAANEKIAIVKMAEEAGHKVLFTPPYHSDLQPIELLWALVKGRVGRQHNNETTLQLVYERLMAEFQAVERDGHSSVQGMIDKCAKVAKRFYDEMDIDEADDGEYASDSNNDDDNDHNESADEENGNEEAMGGSQSALETVNDGERASV